MTIRITRKPKPTGRVLTDANVADLLNLPEVIFTRGALEAEAFALLAESVANDLEAAGLPALRTRHFASTRRELEAEMRAQADDAAAQTGGTR